MRQIIKWAVVGLFAAAICVLAYRRFTRLPDLVVVSVKAEPVERILAAVGRVRAEQSISVYARTAGQVTELLKDEGDAIVTGEVLGRLDAAQPRAVVVQRRAAAEGQQRKLQQSRRDLARAETLLKTGVGTQADFEATRSTVERDAEELARLTAAVSEAESLLENFVIYAPMAGLILVRPIDPGQVVDARTIIFALASGGAPEVETEIDETVAGALRIGMPARLVPAGVGGKIFAGRVTLIAPRVDPTTGGRMVRLAFEDPPQGIPPGLSVDVNVTVETLDRALTLPRVVIGDQSGAPYVLVLRAGRTVKQAIAFVDWPAERVIVTAGLKADEEVAQDPSGVAEGTRVNAIPPPVKR